MLDKITTALIAPVFATLMTWFVLSPFLTPKLYLRACSSADEAPDPPNTVINQTTSVSKQKRSQNQTTIRFVY